MMTDKANTNEEQHQQHKTPLELVHEQQQHQQQTLAEGRAEAEGHTVEHNAQVDGPRVDATPDVVGGGPPSSARNFPQRRNHSHGE
jgi:hypothetical protein